VSAFQAITSDALNSNYSANDHFETEKGLRLASNIVNRNDVFAEDMAQWGHEFDFGSYDEEVSDVPESTHSDDSLNVELSGPSILATRKCRTLPDIEEILPEAYKIAQPLRGNLSPWLEKQYRESRGFEIGTFNPVLLSTIMKKQSSKWTALANGYISDLAVIVHSFIVTALNLACPDTQVCHNLLSVLLDQLLDRYKKAVDKVEFLLHVERSGTPMTLNHYLNESLQKW
jgi:hypothetical protein